MGEGWDPWAALRDQPRVVLAWAHLPEGHFGMAEKVCCGWQVTLAANLDRVGRRCTLAHELIHVERGIFSGPAALMVREEAIVRAETARRLVPHADLVRAVESMVSFGRGVEARHVAEFYDVTHSVAHEALRQLARRAP